MEWKLKCSLPYVSRPRLWIVFFSKSLWRQRNVLLHALLYPLIVERSTRAREPHAVAQWKLERWLSHCNLFLFRRSDESRIAHWQTRLGIRFWSSDLDLWKGNNTTKSLSTLKLVQVREKGRKKGRKEGRKEGSVISVSSKTFKHSTLSPLDWLFQQIWPYSFTLTLQLTSCYHFHFSFSRNASFTLKRWVHFFHSQMVKTLLSLSKGEVDLDSIACFHRNESGNCNYLTSLMNLVDSVYSTSNDFFFNHHYRGDQDGLKLSPNRLLIRPSILFTQTIICYGAICCWSIWIQETWGFVWTPWHWLIVILNGRSKWWTPLVDRICG